MFGAPCALGVAARPGRAVRGPVGDPRAVGVINTHSHSGAVVLSAEGRLESWVSSHFFTAACY